MTNRNAVDLIERSIRETPFCTDLYCGAPTHPIEHAGQLWLECSTIGEPKPLARRLLDFAANHYRRPILDLDALEAAA